MMEPKTSAEWIALLERRIGESGLSVRRFAVEVLRRDARTVARWLKDENHIPQEVRAFLLRPTPAPWPRKEV